MEVLAVLGLLVLLSVLVATQQPCHDMDTDACHLMAATNANLCSDPTLAHTACPRYCNLCPIECYHCNTTVNDFHSCTTTKLCAKDQVCMQKVVTSIVDGHHAYQLSCETLDHCDGSDLTLTFGKRGTDARDVSISCCTKDRCNYPQTQSGGCKKDVTVLMENKRRMHLSVAGVAEFLLALTAKLPIGPDNVHLSFASSDPHSDHLVDPMWSLNTYTSNASISAAIQNIPKLLTAVDARDGHTGSTVLDDLRNYTLSQPSAPGSRSDAANILVGITDNSNGGLDSRHLLLDYEGHYDEVVTVGTRKTGQGLTTAHGTEFLVHDNHHLLDVVDYVAALICP